MDNKDVASILDQIAGYLELSGEDPFRVRAYQSAGRAIAAYPGDLREALAGGALAELKGIGPATLDVVGEVLATRRSRMLEDLRDRVPAGLVEMLRIPGLGVAKVRQIHETLRIDTLDELEEAARDGRLAELPRFGPKIAEKVFKGIQFRRQVSEFRLLHHGREEAADLARVLGGLPEVQRVEVAGSVRRAREVIRDLDFVVLPVGPPAALVERLGAAPSVREFVHRTERGVTLRFASGSVVDVYWAGEDDFGFQLVRATGSAEHLAALEARARGLGLGWSEHGLARDGAPLPAPTEEAVYHALDLPLIAAELREGRGEVERAAAGGLPTLVTLDDLRGFLHCHTHYSDGTSSVREWVEACRAAGYEYLGLTDHSEAAAYAGGLAIADIPRQHAEIDDINRQCPDFAVFKGVEADILQDGRLDYAPAVRARFDFIIASVHIRFGMNDRQMTRRVLAAMDDPTMAILGHPTGRLLLSRDPFALDLDAVFAKAAAAGIAIEINADPQRLDLDWRLVGRAVEAGVMISIGADAHGVSGMKNMALGVSMARKAGLTKAHILNTRTAQEFRDHVARRRVGR